MPSRPSLPLGELASMDLWVLRDRQVDVDATTKKLADLQTQVSKAQAEYERARQIYAMRQAIAEKARELPSLKTDEAGIGRFREIGREYRQMIDKAPTDIKGSMITEMDAFSKLYAEYEIPMGRAESELQKNRLEAKRAEEVRGELGMVYLIYMQLRFCEERFPLFSDAKGAARDIAKKKEAGLPPAQIKETWNDTGQIFAKMEPLLKLTANLFMECQGASNTLAGIVLNELAQPSEAQVPRKDF
jgi:hypothetical protein